MNKYLEKLAKVSTNRTELEPGVYWDHNKKNVVISKETSDRHLNRKDVIDRSITAAKLGAAIGIAGTAYGNSKSHMFDFGPKEKFDWIGYKSAENDWFQSTDPKAIHPDPDKFFKAVPSKNPFLNKVVNKLGGYRVVGPSVFGAAGALVGGTAGYLLGGSNGYNRKVYKENLQENMEKKHEQKIDSIEGWDKI